MNIIADLKISISIKAERLDISEADLGQIIGGDINSESWSENTVEKARMFLKVIRLIEKECVDQEFPRRWIHARHRRFGMTPLEMMTTDKPNGLLKVKRYIES
jgi:hypothetical protein